MINDDAYANSAHIPDGEGYYARWEEKAAAFREGHSLKELGVHYGPAPRQTYDMFHPARGAKGTVVFVHGGYWLAGSPAMFSHLAAGAVAAGYACAMPGYTLAPAARIADITLAISAAIAVIARRTVGPLYLIGHSAGGHLVARMGCADIAGLRSDEWQGRIKRIMPISPLSNLEPLMDTSMNVDVRLDAEEVRAESPVNHNAPEVPVTIVVGTAERPAFLDQAQWLAERWECDLLFEADRHHFDVIEALEDPHSALMRALLS